MSAQGGAPDRLRDIAFPGILFVALAFATRFAVFGNPVIQIDEQFYLLVGDRMWHGWLPYVDIWDRKPIGLFLIYAAIRALGGDGIYEYQVAATLSAAATAFLIYRIASTIAPRRAAVISGGAYLLYLPIFNGIGGQSPVFYNFIVSLAALWTLRTLISGRGLLVPGIGIMLLLGVAIQVKYTVVFEGIFIGVTLLLGTWRVKKSPTAVITSGAIWVGSALLPTACVLAYYMMCGQTEAFLQANFLSVFDRQESAVDALKRLGQTALLLSPILLACSVSVRRFAKGSDEPTSAKWFISCWGISALAGYLIFGSYYDHYALPLLVPLTALAAPTFACVNRQGKILLGATVLVGVVAAIVIVRNNIKKEGTRGEIERIASIIKDNLRDRCMYVYEGAPILYLKTGACTVTKFAFPSHLGRSKEAKAIGVEPVDVLQDLFAKAPEIVLLYEKPRKDANLVSRSVLQQVMRERYHIVGREPLGRYRLLIYSKNR